MANSEDRRVGNLVVHRTSICAGAMDVYSVWEPSSYFGPHGTLFTIDGQVHGHIATRRLPKEIEALKVGSPERIAALEAFRKTNYETAYTAIVEAFPETATKGHRCYGEIEVKT